jgi:hypothetical protein
MKKKIRFIEWEMNMVHDEDLLATRKETESWSDKGNVKMTA